MPEVIGTDDEACQQPQTPRPKMDISVPILNPDPLPVMLQPTVYDPSAKCGPFTKTPHASPSSSDNDGLSSAQRSIEADLLAEAEEAAARSSALKRAKEAVITKLTREFSKRKADRSNTRNKESAAVLAGISALNLSMNLPVHPAHHHNHSGLSCASSSSVSNRLREGLFGRSLANVSSIAPDNRSLESQTALVPLIFSRS
jgi:hypothetical protein